MRVRGQTAAEIAASLERQLHTRTAGAGHALPPVRQLAAKLEVSPGTVAAAYKLLRARGLVTGAGRRGTRVVHRPLASVGAAPPPAPDGLVDLASGNPDPALLPPLEPALRMVEPAHMLYGEPPYDRRLMAFAASEFENDGVPGRAMAVVNGALDGIERILRECLRPGDHVAVEDPCFPGVLDLVSGSGFVPAPLPLDGEGPTVRAVEQALNRRCRALLITPRAQNPTGAAVGEVRAADLRRLLRRFPEVVVIENDCAASIAGLPTFPLRTGADERWAIVRSTSKFLGPDLRLALVAGDAVTIGRVRGRQALGVRWVSHVVQRLALALWSDPSNARRLARAGEVYTHRRRALEAALGRHGIHVTARSGFNLWVPVRDEQRVVAALATCGWSVAAGERFRIQAGPGIRVTTSRLEVPDADRFAADLASALRRGSVASA
jgi:DNA-binding transcriptional MocR family regulator